METKLLSRLISITFIMVFITGISLAQDKLTAAFETSYAQEKKGEFSKAVETLKGVYDEKSYEINLRLGWLLYEGGMFTESMTYYQKAIALMPYAIEPHFGLVYPAGALTRWDLVVEEYNKILKVDPNNYLANYRMGLINYNRKDYNAAYKHFEKIVNLFPFTYDGLIMFAWSNFQLGKSKEAKVLFSKVLMLSPNDASALEGLKLIK